MCLYTCVVRYTFSKNISVRLFCFINKSRVHHFVDYVHEDWKLSHYNHYHTINLLTDGSTDFQLTSYCSTLGITYILMVLNCPLPSLYYIICQFLTRKLFQTSCGQSFSVQLTSSGCLYHEHCGLSHASADDITWTEKLLVMMSSGGIFQQEEERYFNVGKACLHCSHTCVSQTRIIGCRLKICKVAI